mmetsp:Transcript_13018/g.22498  ORF Transcript_13018/g.22498 Transcript_13018/m.22498 type:complete len:451 (+) Transcript_13018:43-1395(+)
MGSTKVRVVTMSGKLWTASAVLSATALSYALVLCISGISLSDKGWSFAYALTSQEKNLNRDPQETGSMQNVPDSRAWTPTKGWGHLQKGFQPDMVSAEKCRAYSCFNFSKCPGPSLKIYTYPDLRHRSLRPIGFRFASFLSYITASGLETLNPEEACIFIPPYHVSCTPRIENADKNLLTLLRELPFWNNGRNHLIAYENDLEPVACYGFLDQSIYMSSTQSLADFRFGYDVSVPIFSDLILDAPRYYNRNVASRHPLDRKLLVSFKGSIYERLGPIRRNVFELAKAYTGHPRIQIFFNCKNFWKEPSVINCRRLKTSFESSPNFTALLADSVFGLCPEGWGHHSYRLLETMMFGAIPVVLSDECVFPFAPEVNWSECVIHFPERLVPEMIPRLSKLSPDAVRRRQLKCLDLFEGYFLNNIGPESPARADGRLNSYHHALNFLAKRVIPA